MIKAIITEAVISKGFENSAALKFSESGDSVRFRIGKKVYDARADNNSRWLNFTVKAFGGMCERIRKMQFKEGSYINLVGRLDEDSWVDQDGVSRSQTVIILEDIEYPSGTSRTAKETTQGNATTATPATAAAPAATSPEATPLFEGYQPFGGDSFFNM